MSLNEPPQPPHVTDVIEHITNDLVPRFLTLKNWPESLRKEFLEHLYKSMANLTEIANRIEGRTLLFIPQENLNDIEKATLDNDLIQRLESCLIHWTRQVKEVVSETRGSSDTMEGPLEEIAFWENRNNDLSGIGKQLDSSLLHQIQDVLRASKSQYLAAFEDLSQEIHHTLNETKNNLLYLNVLKEPCTTLSKAVPGQIVDIVPIILPRIVFIWKKSDTYRPRLGVLLSKISNEIIHRCIAVIHFENIFDGNVSSVIRALSDSIQAGLAWQSSVEKMCEFVQKLKKQPEFKDVEWIVEEKTMFAHLLAFIQRCKEILDVCSGQVQFGIKLSTRIPLFSGPHGMNLERSFNDIQAKFSRYIAGLKGLSYSVLDVRETKWHEDYSILKDNIGDLEAMLTTTIATAFTYATSVSDALDLYKALHRISIRDHVCQQVDKYRATIWHLFIQHVQAVQAEFEKQKARPPIPRTWPQYGGAAVWASSLMDQINGPLNLLESTGIEFVSEEEEEAGLKLVEMALNVMVLFIKNNYSRWLTEAVENVDFEDLKKNFLFTRQAHPAVGSMLVSNFDGRLTRLFNEVHFWHKLPTIAQIPTNVVEFVNTQEAELRVGREQSMLVVRDYNRILLSLPVAHKAIFRAQLRTLDNLLLKGTKNMRWNAPAIKAYCEKCRAQCDEIMKVVSTFKQQYRRIIEGCLFPLSRIPLLFIDPRHSYRLDEFMSTQGLWKAKIRAKLTNISNEVQDILRDAYVPFRDDSDNVIAHHWETFLTRIDAIVLEALHMAVKRTLTDLYVSLVGDSKTELTPLFIVDAVLSGQKTDWNPQMKYLLKYVYDAREDAVMTIQAFPRIVAERKRRDIMEHPPRAVIPGQKAGDNKDNDEDGEEEEEDETGSGTVDEDEDDEEYRKLSYEEKQKRKAAKAKAVSKKTLRQLALEKAMADAQAEYEILLAKQPVFYDEIKNFPEIRTINRNIQDSFKPMVTDLRKFEQDYKALLVVFQLDKDPEEAFNETYNEFPKLAIFEAEINQWRDREKTIQMKDPSVNIHFIRVDAVPLKEALIKHCKQRQEMFVGILNKTARTTLNSIYTEIDSAMQRISKPPRTLVDLKTQDQLIKDSRENFPKIEAKFEPLQRQYELLDRCSDITPVPDQETVLLLNIPSKFTGFQAFITQAETKLQETKATKRKELLQNLDQLAAEITATRKKFLTTAPYSDTHTVQAATALLDGYRAEIKAHREEEQRLLVGIELFGLEQRVYSDLSATQKDVDDLSFIWGMKREWGEYWDSWKTGQFNTLNVKLMDDKARLFTTDLLKRKADCGTYDVWKSLKNQVDTFKLSLPLITHLRNEAMRERHWAMLKQETRQFDHTSADFTLDKIFEIGLQEHIELIAQIGAQASEESVIEKKIAEVEEVWGAQEYTISPYKQIWRVGSVEDIEQAIDDHLMELASMKGSRYVATFVVQLEKWEKSLTSIQVTTEKLMNAQKEWLYLESIFGVSEDMRRQMAKEAREFAQVNHDWENIMKNISIDKVALHTAQIPGIVNKCVDIQKKLENIKNSLNKFLEDKRMLFPRFYFLSDDDLLKILGHARDPQAVRPHLKKCFCSLNDLHFASERKATKMFSLENEEIQLVRPLTASGAVEAWLADLEAIMVETIRAEILRCHDEVMRIGKRREWIMGHKLQMLLAAGQILWTAQIEHVLSTSKSMKKDIKQLRIQQQLLLNLLTKIISTEKLNYLDRLKLVSLITIEDHAREVLRQIAHARTNNPNDFLWKQQLRFYRRMHSTTPAQDQQNNNPNAPPLDVTGQNPVGQKEEHVVAEQTNWAFRYGYEYLGCTDRLVITGLTDRCYITMVTALYLKLGGNPQGPAGTGKTETVKDLSRALGLYIIIFNCSEGLDQNSMGRMFSGLAQCGAWSCFDEFNRIGVEVLSVIAQQLQEVLSALEAGVSTFLFEGKAIPIKESCGVFVTMNPGYAGRSELPDNLKAIFRPVSMMVPDSAMIARIRLYAEGFKDSEALSQKVHTLYSLSMQQLSRQAHYDWGLRAIKSVLVTAGTYHRQNPDQQEDVVLYRACMNMNFPKLLADDLRLFMGLLNDLFPTVSLPAVTTSALIENIQAALVESPEHYQIHQKMINKIVQLSETKDIRHGVMIVGKSGSYKSALWKTLSRAKNRMNKNNVIRDPNVDPNAVMPKVHTDILNPKAVTNDELFGYFDKTPEWHDGIVSNLVMRAASETTPDEKWIVFDGPVDTLWIESMNSVLDESKVLTLTNQARITFPPQVSFVFEVEDLNEASPATVSRCGIIFMDLGDFGWMPFLQSWLVEKELDEKNKPIAEILRKMIDKNMAKAVKLRSETCKELIKTSDLNGVQSFVRLFDALCDKDYGFEIEHEQLQREIELLFTFSLIWSLGATLDEATRKMFDDFIHTMDPSIPPQDTVYEYTVDLNKMLWARWEDKYPIAAWKPPADLPYHRILVPTVDTLRHEFIMKILIKEARNVLLMGTTGTGKTALTTSIMGNMPEKKWICLPINFSAKTLSSQVQDTIESRTDKRGKKYSPIGGKRLLTFIDDLNMPAHDAFHSQPPIELLRQWMNYSGWYNRRDRETSFTYINGMQLLCAMGPPGGGRNTISNRTLNNFNILNFIFPTDNTIKRIFSVLLEAKLGDMDDEIKQLIEPITTATLQIYKKVVADLRPLPAKSHYIFNMRDISHVFEGVRRAPKNLIDKDGVIRLWMHECYRVFHDRLVDDQDRTYFTELIKNELGHTFKTTWSKVAKDVPLIFADFIHERATPTYEEVKTLPQLKGVLAEKLSAHNETGSVQLPLVLFNDAMNHLTRIERIITQPLGHALLVGVGGSGRESLARLATFTCDYHLFMVEVTRNFHLQQFRDSLKELFRQAGLDHKNTVFLFRDSQICEESFLEDINSILTSAEVPNIFQPDEMQQIRDGMKEEARKKQIPETPDLLYSLFIQTVREHLHVILCMSPNDKQFRNRLRMYPGLVSCTTIDWFSEWPHDALLEVGKYLLEGVNLVMQPTGTGDDKDGDKKKAKPKKKETAPVSGSLNLSGPPGAPEEVKKEPETILDKVCELFCGCHEAAVDVSDRMMYALGRRVHITPTSYRELCQSYRAVLTEKRQVIESAALKLRSGLGVLKSTREDVEALRVKLDDRKQEVMHKTTEVEELMMQLFADRRSAEEQTKKVSEKRARVMEEEVVARTEAQAAQKELDKVMPGLQKAQEALEMLTAKDIAEVRAYASPPMQVQVVMQAVMILCKNNIEWADCRKKLSDPHFISDLKSFKSEELSDKQMRQVEKYIKQPHFNYEDVSKVSLATACLCEWVCNVHKFKLVWDQVAPIQAEVKAKLALLEKKQQDLKESELALEQLQKKVELLNQQYQEKTKEMEELKQLVSELEAKLSRANVLVSNLAGERERWMAQVQAYDVDLGNLLGDALLAAAFLSYAGPFTFEFRQDLVKIWMEKLKKSGIPCTPEFSFENFLADSATVRNWIALYGLPNDAFSIANGLLVTRGRRWPLMIDPQGQANKWIKALYKDAEMIVLSPLSQNFVRTIERGIQFGLPVLMQDIGESIDPVLAPVIDKALIKINQQDFIKVGENPILYNEKFRFIMTTKYANPNYSPEVSTKTTIVNFAVKEQGLEEQLLGMIVAQENPDLDKQRNDLVVGIAKNKSEMSGLENKILQLLSSLDPSKSLIDDEEMVSTLQISKVTADRIQTSTTEMEETNKKIEKAREAYRPAAQRASLLFFVMVDLAQVDSMYQYSLDSYLTRFRTSLKRLAKEKKATEIADRVAVLNSIHMDNIYRFVVRGLFERHKILFSFQMCMKILIADKKVNLPEYQFFLKGGVVIDKELQPKNSCDWLQEPEKWDNICELEKLDNFHGIVQSFDQSGKEWRKWYRSSEPEAMPLPGEWESKCNDLQRLVIVRSLRPDRVLPATTMFISAKLGQQFTLPPPFSLSDVVDDSPVTAPIIFVLSPGVDPTGQLRDLAEQYGYNAGLPVPGVGKNLYVVALGRGQWEGKAMPALDEAVKLGNWVFLANCHLDIPNMTNMERIVFNWGEKNHQPHKDFRLWLSSSPHPLFPIALLQSAVKITTEPPRGIKANMQRLYVSGLKELESKKRDHYNLKYTCLTFALCFFHSVLLERRKFASLGFNIPYDFNDSDFIVSERLIDKYLEQAVQLAAPGQADNAVTPWDAIRYLVAEANYGGRITEFMDRRLVNVYVEELFRDEALVPGKLQLCSLPQYIIPEDVSRSGILTHVNSFPDADKPEVFGQHPNADISSQIQATAVLLDTILRFQPRAAAVPPPAAPQAPTQPVEEEGEGGKKKKDANAAAEAPKEEIPPLAQLCMDILDRVPERVGKSVRTDESTPLGTVLVHETERYNNILNNIRGHLSDLVKGLRGEVVISEELDKIAGALERNAVPASWQKGYPSLKPLGTWTRDLQERIQQLSKWGETEAMPKVFWLGGLTFPTGFLTSVKQTALKVILQTNQSASIDKVGWEFAVLEATEEREVGKGPSDGSIYARGLYLEGGGWDIQKNSLVEPEPMQLTCPMPIIHFKPAVIGEKKKSSKAVPQYPCPCYYYPFRTGERERPSYMLEVFLNTAIAKPEHWIKRGTALLMNLST